MPCSKGFSFPMRTSKCANTPAVFASGFRERRAPFQSNTTLSDASLRTRTEMGILRDVRNTVTVSTR